MTAAPGDAPADRTAYERTVGRFRETRIVLPTFAELVDPPTIPAARRAALAGVDPDAPDPGNLFRVHWYNAADRRGVLAAPGARRPAAALTGVEAPIVVALGDRFPMIAAHKVLAAYACLAPRLVTGQFDPTTQRAIWPSTGNYCRGGVAISRIMGCRGVAVLPEGMSRERFDWLERWVADPARHHPDAGHGEQRQGDLRPLRRAGARPGERDPQPVLRVREPPRPLPGDRSRARARRRGARRPDARPPSGCLRVGHRLGGDDRRGRLPQGALRDADRGGRGARVPDDAPERVRRAQHPGHRRQAHPADPQRDEHRPRGRHLGPRHGPAARPLQHGRRAGLPRRQRGVPDAVVAELAVVRHLLHLQRPRRDQDGEAAGPGPRRRGRHGRHRRRGDVPDRAARRSWPATSRPASTPPRPPRRSAATCSAPAPTTSSS